jgi:protein-disulfide isomerase
MYDLLFENQQTWANQSGADAKKTFTSYARSLGLDVERFEKDLNSAEIKAKIENNYQSGVKSGVDATPTFFLNGKKLPPPRSYKEFENAIVQAINANQ